MAGANADDDRNNRQIASQSTDSAADVPGKRGNEDASFLVEISCSICLELVVDDGSRSSAKLQCGHQFHCGLSLLLSYNQPFVCYPLMGQWLFANGSTRLFPEFVMEDWIPEEDLYALSYPEMVNFVQPYIELQVLSLQIHHSSQFLSSPFHHSLYMDMNECLIITWIVYVDVFICLFFLLLSCSSFTCRPKVDFWVNDGLRAYAPEE
ncbi:hypothetical protein HID58_082810, partial [Brassica napus]